ncbi:MAG: hypothetical protein PHW11_02195 [Anaerolineaceae bacterium]|jgi:hypothetical protein|nr:hypothetical protein [Anaerolineaceae bacterium]MDD4043065.1 hypothetical protein [Anaerolineaceae bacterium]MDD4576939.1 hypothetical protein [Anaerolineaceae bacterium]
MNKKNTLILAIIGIIILTVGIFFIIRLSRDPVVVYEDNPATPDNVIYASMDEIESHVSELRGLEIEASIPRELLSREELREVVLNDFLEDYTLEDEAQDLVVMNLFGFLPADFKLRDFYLELYTEQIAGFYDSEKTAMYVVSDSGFGGMERSTYAHEFVHVLQDEHFDFEGSLGYTDEACQEDSERCVAIQSLIEGDASLSEQLWFQTYGTKQDLKDLQDFATTFQSPVYDSAPDLISESLVFPYLYGGTFVQALYAQEGYSAIDKAFTTTQPVSSEQIMHPDAYPHDLPNNPTLPDLEAALGANWVEIENDTLGEWYVYMILAKAYNPQHRLFDSLALDAAEGWGGDRYSVLKNDQSGEAAGMVAINWDSEADATAALRAFNDYSNLRFGAMGVDGFWQGENYYSALLQTSPTSFVWIVAQELDTLQSLQAIATD